MRTKNRDGRCVLSNSFILQHLLFVFLIFIFMILKESDFVSRNSSTVSGSGSNSGGAGGGMSGGGGASSPSHSAANSTLNRPMSSQGGTRYEDKTLSLQRSNNASGVSNPNNNGQANRQQSYRVKD